MGTPYWTSNDGVQAQESQARLQEVQARGDASLEQRRLEVRQLKRQVTNLQAGPLGRSVPEFTHQQTPPGAMPKRNGESRNACLLHFRFDV